MTAGGSGRGVDSCTARPEAYIGTARTRPVAERLDIDHGLPDDIADALGDDLRTVGTLYNDMQDLDDDAFDGRFAEALEALREAVDADADFVISVLGLAVDPDSPGPLVADASLLSVHEPHDDGSVDRLFYTGSADGAADTFVMLPIRPDDCPPGSDQLAAELSLAEFRDIVSAMVYQRFDFLQNDLDSYRDSYLRPTVRGLEAYVAATRADE